MDFGKDWRVALEVYISSALGVSLENVNGSICIYCELGIGPCWIINYTNVGSVEVKIVLRLSSLSYRVESRKL